eukprot:jgi/Botrbrau1/18629/Bobra.0367s0066.2
MLRPVVPCACQTCCILRPLAPVDVTAHGLGRPFPRPAYQRPVRVRGVSNSRSFDDDEDLDYESSAELAKITDPLKFQALAKHLELMWKISQTRSPSACDCCAGTGERECSWCHGTGVLTVGEEIYCNELTGCRPCPICNHTVSSRDSV